MTKRYRSIFMLPLMVWLPTSAMAVEPCTHLSATGNPDYPPFLWRNPDNPGQLIGANADVLKYVAQQLGLQVDVVHVGPWPRAQEEVRTGRIDILAGYFITQGRTREVDFVSPPFLSTPSVVWVRKDAAFPYGQWSDLQGRSGGTLVNNSYGQHFDDFARAHLALEAVPTAKQAFQKLLLKRNDYVIYEHYPGLALARTLGMEHDLLVLQPAVSSEGLHVALSRKSACNQELLRAQLAEKMVELVKTPLPEQFLRQNLALWDRQHLP
ncbi:amino acid ABC transporter substrate-binding protein [Pseudomonas sp. SDI]|uniref:substrate-binding periplasmic protein n=1 Tax=Pseudomonas sp. SDI TaxID=2170734 RepID=UPI000DE6450B|nr:transporter substrate-binding domain-containing protein [Pseudomonas sp. SDI]PWB35128.1 amino acid ABC transporter substrate-binding protein [Pseudomonas sp. SDI]